METIQPSKFFHPSKGQVISDWEKEYGHLKGKRLLILGGGGMAKEIVLRAKHLGVYCVVMGTPIPIDEAKELADKGIDANATSVDEIIKVVKEENIDGITTGYVDILLTPCLEACNQLGMPFYATHGLIDITTNKDHYREFCNKLSIPCPKAYKITDINDPEQLKQLEYPIFIKPVDNSGSRGAYLCNNEIEFKENFIKALAWSPSKTIAVEEYLTGQDIILDYLVKDGKAHMVSMFDRLVTEDRKPPINSPNIQFSPSHGLKPFLQEIDHKIQNLCKELGIENGILFFQGYNNNGKIKLFEMGCRLGGSFFTIEESLTDINPIDALIHYALTGKMADYADFNKINPSYNGIGCALYLLLKKGETNIHSIRGLDQISKLPYVVHTNAHFHSGDVVNWSRRSDVRLITIYISAPDSNTLKETVKEIYQLIKVEDKDGNNILAPLYEIEKINL